MTENLDTVLPADEKLKDQNNTNELPESSTSYRGFTSIDQEMERDIAMQWFGQKNKNQFFRGNFLYKGKLS